MRLALALLATLLLTGCTLVQEHVVRDVSGPTDGYNPTATFLKLNVKRDDGSVALLDFDRRDWYTSKIAEMVDLKQIEFVSAQAMPRDILNEYVAQSVADPSSLAKLRYEEMGATAEQRMQMDSEYSRLLERVLAPVPSPAVPASPIPAAIPEDPLGSPGAGSG